MRKTLIALLALSSVAMAAELNYTGDNNGWFEVAGNWTDVQTGTISTSKPQDNDKVTIAENKTVKLGNNNGNHNFRGMTITIADGATLLLDGNYNDAFSGCNLIVNGTFSSSTAKAFVTSSTVNIGENGSVSLTADDCKIGNGTVWNVASAQGLTLGKTWLDNNANQGLQTFNLGALGSVVYSKDVLLGTNFNGYSLTATCTDGYVAGEGDVTTYTRELVKFNNGITLNGGSLEALNQHLSGVFSLNGTELTAGDLTVAGHFNLAYLENSKAIVLSYSAYSSPPIPEPTTGSLSLLALAGLCARRRKK